MWTPEEVRTIRYKGWFYGRVPEGLAEIFPGHGYAVLTHHSGFGHMAGDLWGIVTRAHLIVRDLLMVRPA